MGCGVPSDHSDDLHSWSRVLRIVFTALMGIPAGAIPGVLVAQYVSWRVGVALVFLGMPIGAVVAFGIARPARILRLLTAVLVARNVRSLEGKAFEWVDTGSGPDETSEAASDRLLEWLSPRDAGPRRGGWVLAALVVGVIGGGVLTGRDVFSIKSGGPGILLPIPGAKDSLPAQAVLMSFCTAVWTAGGMGLLVSRSFRRPILLAAGMAGYLGICVGIAADDGRGSHPFQLAIALVTAAVAVALLLTGLGESANEASPDDDSSAEGA